jgi:hypothetical protein
MGRFASSRLRLADGDCSFFNSVRRNFCAPRLSRHKLHLTASCRTDLFCQLQHRLEQWSVLRQRVRAASHYADDSRCQTRNRSRGYLKYSVFRVFQWTNNCVSIVLRKRSVMDMVVLGAVCVAAFFVIPALWWSRGVRPGAPGTVPDCSAQERPGFARGRGIQFPQPAVGVFAPNIPRAA